MVSNLKMGAVILPQAEARALTRLWSVTLKMGAVVLPQAEARPLTRLWSVTLIKVRAVVLLQAEARTLDLLHMMSSVRSLNQLSHLTSRNASAV